MSINVFKNCVCKFMINWILISLTVKINNLYKMATADNIYNKMVDKMVANINHFAGNL